MLDREKLKKPCSPQVDKARNELQKSVSLSYRSELAIEQCREAAAPAKKAVEKTRELRERLDRLKAG